MLRGRSCTDAGFGATDDEATEAPLQPQAYPLLTETLRSCHKEVLGDEPCFTCWGGWVDREVRLVCDYILLKGALLQTRRVLQAPSALEVLQRAERMPHPGHPSDHVP